MCVGTFSFSSAIVEMEISKETAEDRTVKVGKLDRKRRLGHVPLATSDDTTIAQGSVEAWTRATSNLG